MAERAEIDEIRERTDIVAVVEQYVSLKRAGDRYRGLCPFHHEKTPSFNVNADSKFWHCFGCSEGGDVIKFLQKIENLSFIEAVERLALRAGITLTNNTSERRKPGEISERDRLQNVNALALKYYRESLARSPEARAYAAQRGLDDKTIADFSIGYASESWDGLAQVLHREKAPMADAETAGLVSPGRQGGWIDRMRGRLVFPIFDVHERPIAFGGRILVPVEGQPKYWNSPETPIFQKRTALYGLWRARTAMKELGYAILVEGYTDVIAMHTHGFENAVATLGTALSEDHVKILRRLASRVLLAFDANSAGLKAALRATELFEANEIGIGVLDLPEGEDPDSMLRAGRKTEFQERIDNAVPMIEYRVGRLLARAKQDNVDGVVLFRKLVPLLAEVTGAIELDRYIRMVARYHPAFPRGSAVAEQEIRQDILQYRSRMPRRAIANPEPPTMLVSAAHGMEKAEIHIVRALLSDDQELARFTAEQINADHFPDPTVRSAIRTLIKLRLTADPPVGPIANWVDDPELGDFLSYVTAIKEVENTSIEEVLTKKMISDDAKWIRRPFEKAEFDSLVQRVREQTATQDDYQRLSYLRAEMSSRLNAGPKSNNVRP